MVLVLGYVKLTSICSTQRSEFFYSESIFTAVFNQMTKYQKHKGKATSGVRQKIVGAVVGRSLKKIWPRLFAG